MNWFNKLFGKKEPIPNTQPEPVENKKNDDVPSGRQYITGNDVTYLVPDRMRSITVQIQEPNGRVISEYVLSEYLQIEAGNKIRIITK